MRSCGDTVGRPQRFRRPPQQRHRITAFIGLHQRQQRRPQFRIQLSQPFAATALPADPAQRILASVQLESFSATGEAAASGVVTALRSSVGRNTGDRELAGMIEELAGHAADPGRGPGRVQHLLGNPPRAAPRVLPDPQRGDAPLKRSPPSRGLRPGRRRPRPVRPAQPRPSPRARSRPWG
jgi:hypothetical protein